MSKIGGDSDYRATSEWTEDEKFADFFEEYIQGDIYRPEADENLKTFITYRSLYLIYINSQKAQDEIKAMKDQFSAILELLTCTNKGLSQLQNIITTQKEVCKTAKRNTRFLMISIVGLFVILVYFIYKIFFSGEVFP